MINSGEAKNQAELARIKGISRARVTQILNLLKLDSDIIQKLDKLGDPLESKIVTENCLFEWISSRAYLNFVDTAILPEPKVSANMPLDIWCIFWMRGTIDYNLPHTF